MNTSSIGEVMKSVFSIEIISSLAKHEYPEKRRIAARLFHCPVDVLAMLSKDRNWSVRQYVAFNPSTPYEILILLACDENEDVRETALKRL